MAHEASVVVFIAQIVVLLIVGRLMGELMQRMRQPAVMGQILAGVLLGPSVLGVLTPGLAHQLFPSDAGQQAMLDAVAQLGILLLLLMTGLETDLAVFREARRPALSISIAGILVPFVCGATLGAWLPDWMLPSPGKRVITALFLGTALSISSVKIVALVVRDLGFVRRTVGQVIIASSILDDTIGWLIISVILGLTLHGAIDLAAVSRSLLGTLLFLALSFTLGRRLVFRLLRWSNDHLIGEMATISTIIVIGGLLALITNAIGVHLILGAFVAGVLIGQSPTLTARLDAQLRGLIVALFMPVFFALAGLATDLKALGHPQFLWLTGELIVFASVGKFLGAFVGGRIGGLSYAESFAVGCGMNARGSTEIIVASIGLSMGALNDRLFTAIVAMAVVTTLAMPPMLRWALSRLPLSGEEKQRIERAEHEERGFLTRVERLLTAADASPSGELASRLVGLLAGVRRIPATVLNLQSVAAQPGASDTRTTLAARAGLAAADAATSAAAAEPVDITTRKREGEEPAGAIAAEARKGYGLLVIGLEPAATNGTFDRAIAQAAASFDRAFAIVVARGVYRHDTAATRLRILVPVSGTRISRQGSEVAVALAQATHGTVTALYAASGARPRPRVPWRRRIGAALAPEDPADAAIREVRELGSHYGVHVRGKVRKRATESAVLAELHGGQYDLVVMGVTPRAGEHLSFGESAAAVLERADCSLIFVSGDSALAPDAHSV
jgi:Kef-type K+ transport system membrane component KefB/nucleotide-binding universal stress UspA family protein